jgi:hypothetical protein
MRTEHYEQNMKHVFHENWVISPVDIKALHMEDCSHCIVVPNMVLVPDSQPLAGTQWRIVFTGNMSVAHNISAAKTISIDIMPLLLSEYPQLKFYIIGASPAPQIMALNGINNTYVLGFVPDLTAELQKSDVFIAPLHFSAGIQNKVLEAMACAIPVISTPNVAESLDCSDNNQLLIAASNIEFAQKTKELLKNESLRRQIGRNGQDYVQKHFGVNTITELIRHRIKITCK